MASLRPTTRLALAVSYLVLLLLGLYFVSILYQQSHWAIKLPLVWLYAVPVLLTKFISDLAFGGPNGGWGGLIFITLLAAEWLPLLIIAVFSGLWAKASTRRALIIYLATILLLSTAGFIWLLIDPSLLAS